MIRSLCLGGALLLMLAGCIKIGPAYQPPDPMVETAWIERETGLVSSQPSVDPRWWSTAFNDPELDQLVDMAVNQNLSLRSAALQVLQAQQQLAIAVGNQFPQQQQATGSSSRQKENGATFNEYSLGVNIGWEIDFWGRFKNQVESATAEVEASVASYDAALVSLAAQVAQNYVLIRTYQQRLEVARSNIELQKESLRIARAKLDAGEVSELDVDQAESLLYNTLASVPELEISLQQLQNSLAILLGKPPRKFNGLMKEKQKIPEASVSVALGMPQDLVRRRPDIRLAERQLAAQSEQIGYAMTELYPHLSIGGSIGTSAIHSSDLFRQDYQTWSLFGMFEWNIFNYGRLRSNVRLQDALFQQLLVGYLNDVLIAQGDVENAIIAYLKSHDQLSAYTAAANASQRAVNIATIQYQEGAVDFNTLINTLSANLQQQDVLSATRGDVATNLVQVYKALGGGWEIRNDRDPVEFLPAEMKKQMRDRTEAWQGVLH